jgi:hypothetical protein
MTGAAAWQRAYRQRRAAGRAVFQVEADLFALAEALVASNFLAHPFAARRNPSALSPSTPR